MYAALARSGALADMAGRGVDHVYVYGVDNALARVCDPLLVGACMAAGAEAGAVVLPKVGPTEAVGVFATRGGRHCVVEYSELPAEAAAAVDAASGELRFNAANIAQHYFSLPFLQRCCAPELQRRLAYHQALKKARALGSVPGEPRCLRLEGKTLSTHFVAPAAGASLRPWRRAARAAGCAQRAEARGVHLRRLPVRRAGFPAARGSRGRLCARQER